MDIVKTDNGMLTTQSDNIKKLILDARASFNLENVNDVQVGLALVKCIHRGVNPFADECYLVPYADKVSVQLSVHTLLARAQRNPLIHHFGEPVIYGKDKEGKLERRPVYNVQGIAILGAAVKAHFKDGHIEEYSVPLAMYEGKMKSWGSRLPYMLGKAALANACRRASPTECGGLYVQEEMQLAKEDGAEQPYDPSILHRERIADLNSAGLSLEQANMQFGNCKNREEHDAMIDAYIEAHFVEAPAAPPPSEEMVEDNFIEPEEVIDLGGDDEPLQLEAMDDESD